MVWLCLATGGMLARFTLSAWYFSKSALVMIPPLPCGLSVFRVICLADNFRSIAAYQLAGFRIQPFSFRKLRCFVPGAGNEPSRFNWSECLHAASCCFSARRSALALARIPSSSSRVYRWVSLLDSRASTRSSPISSTSAARYASMFPDL